MKREHFVTDGRTDRQTDGRTEKVTPRAPVGAKKLLTFSENRRGVGGGVNPKLKNFNFLVFFLMKASLSQQKKRNSLNLQEQF